MCSVKTALLLSGLAALATAQDPMVKVEPDDIPFGCATICGPIVELTDICHVGSHPGFRRRLKRRKIEKRQFVTNAFGLVVPAPERTPTGGRVVTVTTVVTLTATPSQAVNPGSAITTPAAGSNNPSSQVMTTTMTMVLPEDDTDGGDLELPADDTGVRLAFPTTTSTPLAVGNAADGIDMGDVYEYAEQETEVEDAERDCVCNNKSFDVALVSGLCTSCIQQAGWAPESMGVIMDQCQFAEQVFTDKSDAVVNNVRIKAVAPTLPAGIDSSLISDSPPSPRHGTGFAGALAAGVACGLALLL
ncbi:hypothetical protein SAPIO_CDS1481 [Scedosporium apiospermum]|uniref:Uncharacterized protein n=1 Tax=Pseudallescheria apiosperma TaxID=563466 RepID=A0A084GEE3_PSEDA|nr:uncharacterized protein SAPIO_CDS1481 [Scedosporium apiospermum]KEZ45705.1 hypothetical protein SAPIO_CDS1481 [Scedosporium apiospermum]